jgi:hypothetical protein
MNWNPILQGDAIVKEPLVARIDSLFAQQRSTWPAFREGEAALKQVRTKTLVLNGETILVQANPGRCRSTHAKVDPRSVAERPCFLCPANMPTEERGIAFANLVILPNPYPILPRHCTIPDRAHRPQQLGGQIGTLLELSRAIGPEMIAFYNGPRCGASAPDHLHFQACDARGIPLLNQLPLHGQTHVRIGHVSFGRSMLLFADADSANVCADIERTLEALSRVGEPGQEPQISLLTIFREEQYVAVLLPRAAHRPRCYFAQGTERLAVSPATLEMAGILVVAEPEHFDRLDATVARSIYEEVSLDRRDFERLVASVLWSA